VTFHEELWSGTALAQLALLPTAARDQVEATVQQICREPGGVGVQIAGDDPHARPVYAARAGSVLIVYEIDTIGEMVHILRVVDRG
jgi:hypothetical protein